MPPWSPANITHVILDLDGTLINTEQLVDEVVGAVLGKHDASLDTKTIRNAIEGVRGMRPLDGSKIIIENLKLRKDGVEDGPLLTAEELLAETEVELNGRWGEVTTMPGAERLLSLLRQHEIPTALATSTPAKYLGAKLASHPGLLEGMSCVCTGDEVSRGKPDPSIFLLAAERLGVEDPSTCLVVGRHTARVQSRGRRRHARPRRAVHPTIRAVQRRGRADPIALRLGHETMGLAKFRRLERSSCRACRWIGTCHSRRRFAWPGPVVKGFGRGSKMLGIPTANLDVAPLKLQADALAPGIYFGWASVAKSDPRDVGGGVYRMVMSIGWNPFFDNSKKTIEPWLLHTFERDFYEQELRITVLGYVRPEANFTTIEDLITRIHRDAEVAKTCLALDQFAVHSEDPFLVRGLEPN
jgi:riboflavin kinase